MSTDVAGPVPGVAVRTLRFDPSWRSFASTQGGLLAGHLLAAAADATGARPRAVTAHYLGGVPSDADVVVTAEV